MKRSPDKSLPHALEFRKRQAIDLLKSAETPLEKARARRSGMALKDELESFVKNAKALVLIKAALRNPQTFILR